MNKGKVLDNVFSFIMDFFIFLICYFYSFMKVVVNCGMVGIMVRECKYYFLIGFD